MFSVISDKINLKLSDDLLKIGSVDFFGEVAGNSDELFSIRTRTRDGKALIYKPSDSKREVEYLDNSAVVSYLFDDMSVKVNISGGENITWKLEIENNSDTAVEYVDFPSVNFVGKLERNGGNSTVVSSYNEGLLVDNGNLKKSMTDPEYPSQGGYMMFPYMLSMQFMLWTKGEHGIYMGVHDKDRAPKGLDFVCVEDETKFRIRLFVGGNFGENVKTPDIIWKAFDGEWQDGADIYREWIEDTFDAKPISDVELPDWYKNDMPLVITYPVRGIHDMDKMEPNKFFPYENVLPTVDEFAKKTSSRIMVLLMHWEGTAPWAPPYVFPPFGGVEMFDKFMKKLHDDKNLLGVYCSGLGFTEQSNLIETYNLTDKIIENNYKEGFCASPSGVVEISNICTGQRSGYDICPASDMGRKILDDALEPLLLSGVDYIQALDQNHGGGMYFCYSKDHGHPPVPGSWMTNASKELLASWKEKCPNTLLGCESAAAEPYINELRLSDNRYELCYSFGKAIPLYSYIFHPYLKNFMGNQVSCPLAYTTELLEMRLAYSFLAGDLLTLVLNDDGEIMFHWGMRDFSKTPDRDELIEFVAKLQEMHKKYPEVFYGARMVKPIKYTCDNVALEKRYGEMTYENAVLSSAWEVGDRKIQFFVNWTKVERECVFGKDRPNNFPEKFVFKPLEVLAWEY